MAVGRCAVGRGCPLPTGVGPAEGAVPSPEIFENFTSQLMRFVALRPNANAVPLYCEFCEKH